MGQCKRFCYLAHASNRPHADVSSRASGLIFGLSLYLRPYFVYVSSEDAGKYTPELSLLDDVISTKILCECPHTFSLARMNHMQVTTLTLYMLGNFSFLCCLLTFSKLFF